MSHFGLLDWYVLRIFPEDLSGRVILDVACGLGSWGFLIRVDKSGRPYIIGIDVWRPYLEKTNSFKIYDEIVQAQLPNIALREKSVDFSLACDVIEHLSISVGYELLRRLEQITIRTIIVSTPLNWPQDELRNNPYEKHVSEWTPATFAKLGYKTTLIDSLSKTLRLVDTVESFALRRRPTPKFVLAYKNLESEQK